MVQQVRPSRGGFLRPFGCGLFIRDFLQGLGPFGSPRIDPEIGACQADIFYHYKLALHRHYAEEAIDQEQEARVKRGEDLYTEEEYARRLEWHLSQLPYKLVKSRYHSFRRYFHYLKQLGWVEATGQEEVSTLQDITGGHPDAYPRQFYRLTRPGLEATEEEWANPQRLIYPEISGRDIDDYRREKRKQHRYRRPGKYERFLRPFTAGMFIREYLLGHGPEGSPQIDPEEGDFTERIFYHYKQVLRRVYARDAVARENDRRIQKKQIPYTPEEYTQRVEWHLERIPYKLHRARSISFFKYFYYLKRLGFVEPTGREEESYIQGLNCPEAPSRRYYRLTERGKLAPETDWYRPQITLYPEFTPQYFAQKNLERRKYAVV